MKIPINNQLLIAYWEWNGTLDDRLSTTDLLYDSLTKRRHTVETARVDTVVKIIHFVPKWPKGTTRNIDWRKSLRNVVTPVVIPSATGYVNSTPSS